MSNQRGRCQLVPPSDLDGSYLGVARPQTLYKKVTRRSPPLPPSTLPGRQRGVLGTGTQGCQTDAGNGLPLENGLHNKCNHVASPAKQQSAPHFKRTPDGDKRKNSCSLQTCPFHGKLGNSAHESFQDACHVQERYLGPPSESSSEYFCSPHPPRRKASEGLRAKEEPDQGQNFSEEKRKQLLLQKIELEIEKERLQNLLAKQEAKLLQQQQELRQSRLDYHRFKTHTTNSEDVLMDEAVMGPGSLAPAMNGICDGLSSPKLDCGDCLLRTPSRKGCTAPEGSEGIHSGTKSMGFNSDADGATLWEGTKKEPIRSRRGMTPGSGKDAAMSPGAAGPRKELVTAATSPIQHGAWRYETSLLDLVASMSPRPEHPCGKSYSLPKGIQPQGRSCRKPGWDWRPCRAKNGVADLEESRILEDIFFI
ncbi:protein hinderin [Candoia aspera]|uniref:protein hinderin n=1 Tax=Candoia aspera TaxID=51853 RepID=UPI002FD82D6C